MNGRFSSGVPVVVCCFLGNRERENGRSQRWFQETDRVFSGRSLTTMGFCPSFALALELAMPLKLGSSSHLQACNTSPGPIIHPSNAVFVAPPRPAPLLVNALTTPSLQNLSSPTAFPLSPPSPAAPRNFQNRTSSECGVTMYASHMLPTRLGA